MNQLVRMRAVRLQRGNALQVVDESAGHRHEGGGDALIDPNPLQRSDTAIREREIDRAPPFAAVGARIGARLVDRYFAAAAAQQNREGGAGRPGADDRDLALGRAARASASTACNASVKEL